MKPKLLLCLALVLSGGLFGFAISSQAQVSKPQVVSLAVPGRFHEVIFYEQTNLYSVAIIWGGQKATEPDRQPDADIRNLQVWLLQPDGTCIPQNTEPGFVWMGKWGMVNDEMIFSFTRYPTNQVAGVVLRYRGKLYCKEIEAAKP